MILRVAEKEEPQKEQQTCSTKKKDNKPGNSAIARDPFWDGQTLRDRVSKKGSKR